VPRSLRLAKGESYQRIIFLEECGSEFITRWRKRFEAERLGGLYARHRGRIISDKVLSQKGQDLRARRSKHLSMDRRIGQPASWRGT
jgi:hypothetical protein